MRLITTWPNPENKMEKNPKSQRTVIKPKKIKATTKITKHHSKVGAIKHNATYWEDC